MIEIYQAVDFANCQRCSYRAKPIHRTWESASREIGMFLCQLLKDEISLAEGTRVVSGQVFFIETPLVMTIPNLFMGARRDNRFGRRRRPGLMGVVVEGLMDSIRKVKEHNTIVIRNRTQYEPNTPDNIRSTRSSAERRRLISPLVSRGNP